MKSPWYVFRSEICYKARDQAIKLHFSITTLKFKNTFLYYLSTTFCIFFKRESERNFVLDCNRFFFITINFDGVLLKSNFFPNLDSNTSY